MMQKRYLEKFLHQFEGPDQDALEWAILTGKFTLTYNVGNDLAAAGAALPQLRQAYQEMVDMNTVQLVDSYAPLLAETQTQPSYGVTFSKR